MNTDIIINSNINAFINLNININNNINPPATCGTRLWGGRAQIINPQVIKSSSHQVLNPQVLQVLNPHVLKSSGLRASNVNGS